MALDTEHLRIGRELVRHGRALLRRTLGILGDELDLEALDLGHLFDCQLSAAGDVDAEGCVVAGHRAGLADLDRLAGRNLRNAPLRRGQEAAHFLHALARDPLGVDGVILAGRLHLLEPLVEELEQRIVALARHDPVELVGEGLAHDLELALERLGRQCIVRRHRRVDHHGVDVPVDQIEQCQVNCVVLFQRRAADLFDSKGAGGADLRTHRLTAQILVARDSRLIHSDDDCLAGIDVRIREIVLLLALIRDRYGRHDRVVVATLQAGEDAVPGRVLPLYREARRFGDGSHQIDVKAHDVLRVVDKLHRRERRVGCHNETCLGRGRGWYSGRGRLGGLSTAGDESCHNDDHDGPAHDSRTSHNASPPHSSHH